MLLLLLSAVSALGQPLQEAEQASARGREFYDQGRFEEALTQFKGAFAIHPLDRYLFNAAKACVRLQDHEGAIFFYERYLVLSPVASDRESVTAEVGKLRSHLATSGRTEVKVLSQPSGAAVELVPSRPSQVETTPGSLFLPPGDYRLVLRLPGHLPAELPLAVTSPTPLAVEARLQEEPATGRLTVRCRPEAGWVRIAGRELGGGAVEGLELPAGSYEVEVGGAGLVSARLRAEVRAGEVADLECLLLPEEGGGGNGKAVFTLARWRWSMVALAGAGVVTQAVGGWLWWDGWAGMKEANDNYPADYADAYGDARSRYLAGQWTSVVGAVVVAGAVTGWLLWPTASTQPPAATATALPDGGWQAQFSWTF